jgi:hypothetical protein
MEWKFALRIGFNISFYIPSRRITTSDCLAGRVADFGFLISDSDTTQYSLKTAY